MDNRKLLGDLRLIRHFLLDGRSMDRMHGWSNCYLSLPAYIQDAIGSVLELEGKLEEANQTLREAVEALIETLERAPKQTDSECYLSLKPGESRDGYRWVRI